MTPAQFLDLLRVAPAILVRPHDELAMATRGGGEVASRAPAQAMPGGRSDAGESAAPNAHKLMRRLVAFRNAGKKR
jgi:hypothetical protein